MDEPKPRAPLPPTFSSSSRSIDDATTLPVGGEIPTTHASPSGLQETVRAIQLHHAYLVVETNDGMLLVDQHALHERILYEQLRHRVATGSWEVQELLVPEPVDLTPLQAALLIEQRDVLADTGLVIEEFGDRSVLLRGYPAMLRRLRPAELLRSIADRLEETGKPPSRDELLEEVLHMTACKAAVKAGDPLTPEEIDALVRQRHLVDDSHHCPHGRPTILRFTLNDLERQFLRK
jgi:DNA mismatch repair protein MutL